MYRFLVCYILSLVVDVLSPIVTLVRSGGMRLYRDIFVIYAYDRILHDITSLSIVRYVRQVSSGAFDDTSPL